MKRTLFSELFAAIVVVVLIGAFAGIAIARVLAPSTGGFRSPIPVLHSGWFWSAIVALLLAGLISWLLARAWNRRLGRFVEIARRLATDDITMQPRSKYESDRVGRGTDPEGNLDDIGDADMSATGNGGLRESAKGEFEAVAEALSDAANRVAAIFRALEHSRKEMETALDSMEEAVITVNAQNRIQWTNRVMARLAGAPVRPGSALVETVRDPDLLASVAQALDQRVVANARAKAVVPGRIFDASAAPMPGGGAVVVLHDVTEVDRVERTRRDFIANVSHELRTPLTSISGYAETLLEDGDGLTLQGRDFLSVIGRNAARMTRLAEDLLALARIESGEHKLSRRPIAAGLLMDEASDAMSGLFLDDRISLERPETAPAVVLADSDAILQVLSNLLENAVKYGEGTRVVFGSRVRGDSVEFYVRDFGAGIASEYLDRIFERFYRIDKDRSRDSGGTGLGLSIVKHVVLAHGGTVWAESDLDKGSTFFFTLPMA